MSDWMQTLQKMLGADSAKTGTEVTSTPNWGGLLSSAAMGGLAGALLSSKSAKKIAEQVLIVGGTVAAGAFAWDRYKKYMQQKGPAPQTTQAPAALSCPPDERLERLILSLVFAAKADGHIDAAENRAIRQRLAELGAGADVERLIGEAIDQPLDPEKIARGVRSEEEALQIYLLSRSVIDLDHFMERSYLDALAKALGIPDEARQAIEADIKQSQNQSTSQQP